MAQKYAYTVKSSASCFSNGFCRGGPTKSSPLQVTIDNKFRQQRNNRQWKINRNREIQVQTTGKMRSDSVPRTRQKQWRKPGVAGIKKNQQGSSILTVNIDNPNALKRPKLMRNAQQFARHQNVNTQQKKKLWNVKQNMGTRKKAESRNRVSAIQRQIAQIQADRPRCKYDMQTVKPVASASEITLDERFSQVFAQVSKRAPSQQAVLFANPSIQQRKRIVFV